MNLHTAIEQGPVSIEDFDIPATCGGECVFIGRTRAETHPTFGELLHLEYEAYQPMVESLMQTMVKEAAEKFECGAIRLVHAHGRVDIGQASVVIQTATPHRGEAFASCRYLIDRLKHELPIWKREIWQHGETFVEGCCAHSDSDRKVIRHDESSR